MSGSRCGHRYGVSTALCQRQEKPYFTIDFCSRQQEEIRSESLPVFHQVARYLNSIKTGSNGGSLDELNNVGMFGPVISVSPMAAARQCNSFQPEPSP